MTQPVKLFVNASNRDSASGTDVGSLLVDKSYLLDVYPSLVPWIKAPALWLWGYNTNYQLGDNTAVTKSSPVQTVAGGANWQQVACGYYHTAAIKTDGTLWVWGFSMNGGIGDNTMLTRASPVQTIAGGTNWAQVAVGNRQTAAIKNDGSLWLWGGDAYGQLGDNTRVDKSSPVQTVAGGNNWKQVSAGYGHTAAIKTDGTLWAWGWNPYGQLGDNTRVSKSSPVQTIAGGTNWAQVACGQYSTVAVKTDGSLWTWGNNSNGELGDNAISVPKSSPVQTVAGGNNWKQVAFSPAGYHVAAIKTDGTLWTWGNNVYGNLGQGTIVNGASPAQTVAGGNNWKSVACGSSHTAAVKTDGSLWTWGRDTYGQLGDNTRVHKSSPVQTIAGGTNWKAVAGGYNYTAAISDSNF